MGRALNYVQLMVGFEVVSGLLIEFQHIGVIAANDQQRGGANVSEHGGAGKVRSAASRDDGLYRLCLLGRRDQGCCGTRAGSEIANAQVGRCRLPGCPPGRTRESSGQEFDIEAVGHRSSVDHLLLLRQKIQQQGPEPVPDEDACDIPVAAAVAATAASVSEDDKTFAVRSNREIRCEGCIAGLYVDGLHFLTDCPQWSDPEEPG